MGSEKWSQICQGGRGGRGGWWSRLSFPTVVLLRIWCPDNTEILHPSEVIRSQQRQVNQRKGQEQTEWAQHVHVGFLFLLVPTHDLPHHFWLAVATGRQDFKPRLRCLTRWLPYSVTCSRLFCCQTVQFISRLWEIVAWLSSLLVDQLKIMSYFDSDASLKTT